MKISNRENLLKSIEKGMKVDDVDGKNVGKVEFVHFSEANGTVAASPPDESVVSGVIEIIRDAFSTEKMPQELQERLLMHGFIRVDGPVLFGADRYVMPEQIASLENDTVCLKVGRDKLIKD